jgi:Major intrinsic protein
MSNVDSVITTTTNTVVASANTAVSIGRWSNLAIIASSFLSSFAFPYLTASLDWHRFDDTSFPTSRLYERPLQTFRSLLDSTDLLGEVLEHGLVTLVASLSWEVGDGFLTWLGNLS